MINRRTLSASMAMGLLLMTSARTDAADGGGSGGGGGGAAGSGGGGSPAGGTGGFNSGDFNGLGGGSLNLPDLYKLIKLPFELISMAVDYNNKNQAADATKRGTELQVIRREELVGLSKKGDAKAQNELGFNYFHGVGVSRDRAQAMTLYRLSALQDHAEAQNNLGLCYYTNIEGHGDPIEACALWRLAAPTFPKAQINLTYAEGKLPADSLLAITKRTDELRAEIAATLGKKALPPASK